MSDIDDEVPAGPAVMVQLGFAEDPITPLTADTFPNKLGGKPVRAWMNPEHVLDAEAVKCGECEKPMLLLVQVYTPEDHPIESYHRTVYVFCCKEGVCHKKSWRSSQLPQHNPYYPPHSTDSESDVDSEASQTTTPTTATPNPFPSAMRAPFTPAAFPRPSLCAVCNLRAPKTCSKCHTTHYCSREHQLAHWMQGSHKRVCRTGDEVSAQTVEEDEQKMREAGWVFPEKEIVSEPERVDPSRALVPVGDETYENTKVNVDSAFLKFQKRLELDPEQILRLFLWSLIRTSLATCSYARVEYELDNGEPLWVSNHGKPESADIPPCPHCGGERTFEFQILSTLLNYLNINHTSTDSLDWGTLLVYTCKDNCHVPGLYYAEEILWRQDFSEEGVNFGQTARSDRVGKY
ncbi:programmed cell death protein 2 [Endogone sp. FLAS-F59071]|nr:programmed cell death protein 2 [Endogone sp. FLAS-F59071]|eukprot:RUS22173.1 programmed cell death protein 2 [Endogone sp. FLAS-F59071]